MGSVTSGTLPHSFCRSPGTPLSPCLLPKLISGWCARFSTPTLLRGVSLQVPRENAMAELLGFGPEDQDLVRTLTCNLQFTFISGQAMTLGGLCGQIVTFVFGSVFRSWANGPSSWPGFTRSVLPKSWWTPRSQSQVRDYCGRELVRVNGRLRISS